MIDLLVKATSKGAFDDWWAQWGVEGMLDRIPKLVIADALYVGAEQVVPPVVSAYYHVNIRLPDLDAYEIISQHGYGETHDGVTLIDHRTIGTLRREWAGGMSWPAIS